MYATQTERLPIQISMLMALVMHWTIVQTRWRATTRIRTMDLVFLLICVGFAEVMD